MFCSLSDPNKSLYLAHMSDEHSDELAALLSFYHQIHIRNDAPVLSDIGQESLKITLSEMDFYVRFCTKITTLDEFRGAYLQVLEPATAALGLPIAAIKAHQFGVLGTRFVSANMYRLTLRLPPNIPQSAGLGLLFDIRTPHAITLDNHDSGTRYYTLRRSYEKHGKLIGDVDVFLHQTGGRDTRGATWAKSLGVGDVLSSVREHPEKTAHLHGQSLLICDETSMPTVARLLEQWQGSLAPVVVVFLQDENDLSYLQDLPFGFRLLAIRYVCADIQSGVMADKFATTLDTLADVVFDSVWGALEVSVAKDLRQLVLQKLPLAKSAVLIKSYWRLC